MSTRAFTASKKKRMKREQHQLLQTRRLLEIENVQNRTETYLSALQPCHDNVEVGGVDAEGDFRRVRFRADQINKLRHDDLSVQHPVVDVDIENLRVNFTCQDRHRVIVSRFKSI